jgi:hypothetical protein
VISIEPQDLALAIAAHPDRKVFDSAAHQPSFITHNPQESQRRPPTLPSVPDGGPRRRHQSRTAPRPKSPPPTELNPSSRPVRPRCCTSCPFWKSWACGGQSTASLARMHEQTRDREVKEEVLKKGVTVVEWAILIDKQQCNFFT